MSFLLAVMLLLPGAVRAQEVVVVHGRVTAKGGGVPYATLQLQGTSVGVSCNDAGDYELRLPPGHEQDTVVVRSVGYHSQKATVARLLRNGEVRLKRQVVELQTVVVTGWRSPRHLLDEVVKRIGRNYHQRTAWSTFFYRDWRTVDGELYLFDEAVMSVRRSPYSQYADKRGYRLDPARREMESNLKTLLRHRLAVYDRPLLEAKIIKPLGCDQMLAYADDEEFFDPVATPQASFALAHRKLKEHDFEPLREFSADGEDYYLVRSVGPSRRHEARVRHEYTIRKSDLALVRLVTAQQPLRVQAPEDAWVNWYYTTLDIEADSSVWTWEVRDGSYTLTRYCNTKSFRLESHGRGRDGTVQRWQQCHDWVLTDFGLTPASAKEQPLPVAPQTLAGAFGSSDFSSDFWGHYNAIPIDTLPLRLLNEKIREAGASAVARVDSVWVEGRVTEAATGRPQSGCEVQLLQEGEARAVVFCDEEGYYTVGWVPVGLYTMSVLSGGTSLYYAELQLAESAMVNIALMPDTVDLHALKPVEVSATRHMLGEQLITSPDDSRLWNFCGIWVLMDAGPACEDLSWPGGRNPYFTSLFKNRPAWLDGPWFVPREKEEPEEEPEE